MPKTAAEINRAYYDGLFEGDASYWKHMAAPRVRAKRILEAASGLCPKTIGDFGCGGSNMLLILRRRFPEARLAGVDLSGARIARNASLYPDIHWVCADVCSRGFLGSMPFPVDLALSMEVIEHVDDPLAYLANIAGAMSEAGMLVLSTQSGMMRPTEVYVGHIRHFSAIEMEALLRQAGFTGVRAWNEGFPFHNLSKQAANIFPQRIIRDFGTFRYGHYQLAVCMILRVLFVFNSRKRGAQLFATARKAPGGS